MLSTITCAVGVQRFVEVPRLLLLSGAGGMHILLAQAGSELELVSN